MSIDDYILRSIQGHGCENPVGLVGIFHHVDAHQKVILNHEELERGLSQLIASGVIAECSKHQFCETGTGSSFSSFSGLIRQEYRNAYEEYKSWFRETYGAP